MKFVRALALLAVVFALWTCGKDDKPNAPAPQPDVASASVSSTDSARVTTPKGAYIDVPVGAVPLTLDSTEGTMIFSVEKVLTSVTVTNPPQVNRLGDIYRFGPEGFVFERPVEVAIPVTGDYQIGQVMLARIDPITRVAEVVSADYDPAAGVIKAQTQELSEWEVIENFLQAENRAWARVKVNMYFNDPVNYNETVNICVESFTPKFPEDSGYGDRRFSTRASGIWTIPQGTYTFCIEMQHENPYNKYRRVMTMSSVEVENPAGWGTSPNDTNFSMSITQSIFDNALQNNDGCACRLRSTPTPGTGELQVTLTWYRSAPIDLDLWVTDPSGEKCYYANTPVASGGTLDRDNLCSGYQNGAPENIFWENAPDGIYTVDVNWFSDCGNDFTSQPFSVRVAGEGLSPITENGTIQKDQTVRIGRFDLSGGGVVKRSSGMVVLEDAPKSSVPKKQK